MSEHRTREIVAARHQPVEFLDHVKECRRCRQEWPCDAVWLLRQLRTHDLPRPAGRP